MRSLLKSGASLKEIPMKKSKFTEEQIAYSSGLASSTKEGVWLKKDIPILLHTLLAML